MKFSVLMSVYIKENPTFLKESLKSVFNQTLIPNEVVIVEDGPLNDELYDVINEFKMKYSSAIKTIKLEKNSGLGIALNKGLENCKYNYVARMDTDDIARKDRFEKQIKCFKDNPNVSLVGGLIEEFNKEINDLRVIRSVPETNDEIHKILKQRNCFNHMTVMFKKRDVLAVNGYLDCPLFEDYYLWCRMAVKGMQFYNIQEILVDARTGNNMISRRGGYSYYIKTRNFYHKLYKLGFISYFVYLKNLIIRFIVSMLPPRCRKIFYKLFLRKNV